MLIGASIPWLFSSFAIQAVARAAALIVEEVRRQFRLGVLEGKVPPDYTQAVGISTSAAQKELIPLAMLGVLSPVIVGLVLKVEALGGFLTGIIISGQLLAVYLNNAAVPGRARSSSRTSRLIGGEYRQGFGAPHGGVIGGTVGDPFKTLPDQHQP
jgi:K(+)-stimulated pyrophosphate-energized sodium pump